MIRVHRLWSGAGWLLMGVMLLVLAACGQTTLTEGASGVGSAVDMAAASAYCEEQGGRVVERQPVYGTNMNEGQQLTLRAPMLFCNFEAPEPADPTSDFLTQVDIDLVSLYSEQPTLALLAYLEAAPPDLGGQPVSANPSIIHCGQLGGTATYGPVTDASGGGWVKSAGDTTSAFDVITPCMFPDGSAIDSWPITYRANGVIRGVALESVVRYQPDGGYPAIFGPSP